jgi:hypothetical protein
LWIARQALKSPPGMGGLVVSIQPKARSYFAFDILEPHHKAAKALWPCCCAVMGRNKIISRRF